MTNHYEDSKKSQDTKKHPLELLMETKYMSGYQFIDWLSERTDSEFKDLSTLSLSLTSSLEAEKTRRTEKCATDEK